MNGQTKNHMICLNKNVKTTFLKNFLEYSNFLSFAKSNWMII